MAGFRPIRVARVITETADACSLVLDGELDHLPGQYLTVRTPVGARSYSLASAPGRGEAPKITVKRMAGGAVSNWICDRVRDGDTLDMAGPAGTFTPRSLDDELLLLAGGSGITPIMGIIKSMRREPVLFYANRDAESIIFRDELDGLLPVIHWLDRERGVPTADSLKDLLHPYRERESFVCGPEAFVAVAEKALQMAGVPAERIRIERFEPAPAEAVGQDGGRDAVAEVEIDGRAHVLPWAAGRRLLDVIIDAGLNPPWSCRQGQCGACVVRLVSGEVELVHNEILEEEDFADGYTLACQALAVSDHVKVTYS